MRVSQPAGVITAGDDPRQTVADSAAFEHQGYTLHPLENFDIRARVLAAEHCSADREADLSPVDLALGWGSMSDSAVIDRLSISQSGRFYLWRYENEPPIPTQEIISHSANMHMIPASSEIKRELKELRPGEIVSLNGYLVEATANDGWHWRSSLTREDSGDGACEVIWVKNISVTER